MSVATVVPEDEDLWLFGYGSLIWKPPPYFDKRVPGYVEGYVRRFWQYHTAPDKVWGAAYRIPAPRVKEVKELLDIREINGYSIDFAAFNMPVHVQSDDLSDERRVDPSQIKCLVYIGLPTNPQFLGLQEPQELAKHVVKSRGPSGENREYVYNLAESLEQLAKDVGEGQTIDEHVSDLAARVRQEAEQAGV